MKDILLVEDNIELSQLIQTFLKKSGFSLFSCTSGEDAFAYLLQHDVKLILLDIMLPEMDGFALCQKIRQSQNIPILMMSARSTKDDQLLGFSLGADDYLEKPVDPDILVAKIKALLARFYDTNTTKNKQIISGGITMDVDARIAYLNDQQLTLNGKEFDLLYLFVMNPNKTLHKDYVFNQIWGSDSESEMQTLTVHIKMLRAKIEDDPKQPQRITTLWGIGYRYEEV